MRAYAVETVGLLKRLIMAWKGTVPPRGNCLNHRTDVHRVGTVPDAHQFFNSPLSKIASVSTQYREIMEIDRAASGLEWFYKGYEGLPREMVPGDWNIADYHCIPATGQLLDILVGRQRGGLVGGNRSTAQVAGLGRFAAAAA